jgi:transcriptional regulator with XRE-family HTH domain
MLSDKNIFLDAFNPKALAGLVAGKVRQRRLAMNLSQQSLCERSGVSLGTLKRFESKHEISLKHLLMLAVALQSSEEFMALFQNPPYQHLDDLIKEQNRKQRQRGRSKI